MTAAESGSTRRRPTRRKSGTAPRKKTLSDPPDGSAGLDPGGEQQGAGSAMEALAVDVVAGLTPAERRDRWRRLAGTVRWQDETGVRSGAPAPSVAADRSGPG